MAMTRGSLKGRIKTQIGSFYEVEDADELDKFAEAIANAVIDEIQQNAQALGTTIVGTGSSVGTWPTTIPQGGIK